MIVRSGIGCALVLAALLTAGCAHGVAATPAAPAPTASKTPGRFYDDEGKLGRTPAAVLAKTIGCVDLEPQERAPGVAAQVTCGINGHRIYVQTFNWARIPKKYVQGGPGPKPTGVDLLGSNWIVHVDESSFAPTVQAKVGGEIVPAS
jgi:hypothetical protein